MHDDPSKALIDSWTGNARAWATAIREGQIRSRQEVTNAAIINAVRPCLPGRVLDVGCGEGWLCRALAEHGGQLIGVDVSPPLLELATQAGAGDFHCLSYAQIIAEPQRLGTDFDVIVCNFSLLDEQTAELLAALARTARPDAHLIIQTLHPLCAEPPYADGWRMEHFTAMGPGDWQPMPWFYRTLSSWLATLAPAWRLESIEEPRLPEAPLPASLIIKAQHIGPNT
ncbi:class I SAM-dependent methyltransferase [Pseudomonas sp. RHF3.3-3]|uniref:class I SAM-dependent methyltransferase n=1 Tax=Pseudomonas sp. RHF3.3-3 TaxID=3396624 RepID=UPI003A87CF34